MIYFIIPYVCISVYILNTFTAKRVVRYVCMCLWLQAKYLHLRKKNLFSKILNVANIVSRFKKMRL